MTFAVMPTLITEPTAAQRDAFAEHVTWAHSWYKHLPFEGAEFVVFLAADAGAGFETIERMHYGWKTTAEYRARFGHLDYAWRLPGETGWRRDGAATFVTLHPDVVARGRVVLSPFCSSDFNAAGVLVARRDEAPDGAIARALDRLAVLAEAAGTEYAALSSRDREAFHDGASHENLASFAAAEEAQVAFYASLREPELTRLRAAIERVCAR